MKVLQINTVCSGSTGKVAKGLYCALKDTGNEACIAYGRGGGEQDIDTRRVGSQQGVLFHALLSRLTDRQGFYSSYSTQKLVKWILEYKPDVIHLHNIHGYYLNIAVLFECLKSIGVPVIWTLHDCWAFTGHCAHFDMVDCNRWKTGCERCPQKKQYPSSWLIDNSRINYRQKQRIFTSVDNMHLVTPSKWLADRVKESFLKNFTVDVIYNGIDTEVFKPSSSDIKQKFHIENKKIILGVSSVWNKAKGLYRFYKLSECIGTEYQIVLVGLNKDQIRDLPKNILGIPRTQNQEMLAQFYSAADIYVNASVEETMGLTTVEALACGTPVIVYNRTAIPEAIGDSDCGLVIEPRDGRELLDAIYELEKRALTGKKCRNWALGFENRKQYGRYLQLYTSLM